MSKYLVEFHQTQKHDEVPCNSAISELDDKEFLDFLIRSQTTMMQARVQCSRQEVVENQELSELVENKIPQSVDDIMKRKNEEKWLNAMEKEMASFIKTKLGT